MSRDEVKHEFDVSLSGELAIPDPGFGTPGPKCPCTNIDNHVHLLSPSNPWAILVAPVMMLAGSRPPALS